MDANILTPAPRRRKWHSSRVTFNPDVWDRLEVTYYSKQLRAALRRVARLQAQRRRALRLGGGR